jgi:DNA-binding response OmpR family regulator
LFDEGLRILNQMLSSLTEINQLEIDVAPELIQTLALIPTPSVGSAVKVLHIEDDRSVARSMARALHLKGYEVFCAATRDEAMQHVVEHGVRPDLILADFQLALGLTSEEIVSEIVARLHFKPPTIALTGITGDAAIRANSFADRILTKPVDLAVLLHEIDCLMQARRL